MTPSSLALRSVAVSNGLAASRPRLQACALRPLPALLWLLAFGQRPWSEPRAKGCLAYMALPMALGA